MYRLKLYTQIIFNTTGKYFFGVKRSIDPISSGYWIDPWWDAGWTHRKLVTINSTGYANDLYAFPVGLHLEDADLYDYGNGNLSGF